MATLTQARTRPVVAPTRTQDRHHRGALRWVVLAGCVVVALLMLAPFGLMVMNAFKSPADYSTHGPLTLPSSLYFSGLAKFWNYVDFPVKLWNSIWSSAAVAVLALAASIALWQLHPTPEHTVASKPSHPSPQPAIPRTSLLAYQAAASKGEDALLAQLDRDARDLLPASPAIFKTSLQ